MFDLNSEGMTGTMKLTDPAPNLDTPEYSKDCCTTQRSLNYMLNNQALGNYYFSEGLFFGISKRWGK